jgi:hypothetical protein
MLDILATVINALVAIILTVAVFLLIREARRIERKADIIKEIGRAHV